MKNTFLLLGFLLPVFCFGTIPIDKFINEVGVFEYIGDYNGAIDISNYNISFDPLHGPVFKPKYMTPEW